ncbi:MAG TPA: energy transducer TonB [Candidatus Xenobia bacterium]|nr:energy transducer TonB [Candidatus Xenobia bacterium]
MRRTVLTAPIWMLVVFLVPPAPSSNRSDFGQVEERAKSVLDGKELFLRGFYCDNHLQFTADGELLNPSSPGPWTLCGFVKITSVEFLPDVVEIRATRVVAIYNKKMKGFEHALTPKEARIQIALAPGADREAKLGAATQKVFFTAREDFRKALSDYWNFFFWEAPPEEKLSKLKEWKISSGDEPQTYDGKGTQGHNEPPMCLWCQDPEYTEFARNARLEGMVKLWCVVDEQGRVNNIVVVEPMGAGLDEQAVESVRNWKFKPARRYGQPVPIRMTIEVNFRLGP